MSLLGDGSEKNLNFCNPNDSIKSTDGIILLTILPVRSGPVELQNLIYLKIDII